MKRIFFILVTLSVLVFMQYCKKPQSNFKEVSVTSFKGKILNINHIEYGIFNLSDSSEEKLNELSDKGLYKYYTGEIIDNFQNKDVVPLEKSFGFGFKLKIPNIEAGDYIILDSIVKLPRSLNNNGHKITELRSSNRYGVKHSGRYEYIWFYFSDENKAFYLDGSWSFSVFNREKLLFSQDFNAK